MDPVGIAGSEICFEFQTLFWDMMLILDPSCRPLCDS